jgi:hypothetical protein
VANLSQALVALKYEWVIAVLVGFLGGICDSILIGGFKLPRRFRGVEGDHVIDPGFLGNIVVGGGAGFASWALNTGAKFGDSTIDVGPIAASFLAGVGGGELLSGLVRRQLLQGTNEQTANVLQAAYTREQEALIREQMLRAELERQGGG